MNCDGELCISSFTRFKLMKNSSSSYVLNVDRGDFNYLLKLLLELMMLLEPGRTKSTENIVLVFLLQ